MEALNRGIFGLGEVENYSRAVALTQRKMEEVKNKPFTSILSESKAPIPDAAGFQQEVVVASVHADLKQVDVTTFWNVPNGEANSSLITYVVNS